MLERHVSLMRACSLPVLQYLQMQLEPQQDADEAMRRPIKVCGKGCARDELQASEKQLACSQSKASTKSLEPEYSSELHSACPTMHIGQQAGKSLSNQEQARPLIGNGKADKCVTALPVE